MTHLQKYTKAINKLRTDKSASGGNGLRVFFNVNACHMSLFGVSGPLEMLRNRPGLQVCNFGAARTWMATRQLKGNIRQNYMVNNYLWGFSLNAEKLLICCRKGVSQ